MNLNNKKDAINYTKYEQLVISLRESSKANKNLLIAYIIFLFIILLGLTSIHNIDYLKNNSITLVFYNIGFSVDLFLKYMPFIIGLFHLILIHNLTEHYKKVRNFLFRNNREIKFKTMLLFPFIMNSKNLYFTEDTSSDCNIFRDIINVDWRLIILSLFILYSPYITLSLFMLYSNVEYINYMAIAISIINIIYLFRIYTKTIQWYFLIVFTIVILGFIIYIFKSDLLPINTTTNKKLLFFKQTNLLNNLNIGNRIIKKIEFNKSDINNSVFKFVTINNFKFESSKIEKSHFLTSELNDFKLNKSNITNTTFESSLNESDYTDTIYFKLPDNDNKFQTVLNNWKIYNSNITNTIFDNVRLNNITIQHSNINNSIFKDTKFYNIDLNQVSINNSLFYNVIFKNDNQKIDKDKKQERINIIIKNSKNIIKKEEAKFYANHIVNKNGIKFENLRGTIFKTVTFDNILFRNPDFNNTLFINPTFNNCIFVFNNNYMIKNNISINNFYTAMINPKFNNSIIFKDEREIKMQYINNDNNISKEKIKEFVQKNIMCNQKSLKNYLKQIELLKDDLNITNPNKYVNTICK